MRARTLVVLLLISTFLVLVPHGTRASTLWSSSSTHPDETLAYSTTTPRWYEKSGMPSGLLGIWNGDTFTTTASTTAHLWARWNGGYINVLAILFRTSSGGDPFYGSASTTAELVNIPQNDSYYRLNVDATSSLYEYAVPLRSGEIIHRGDELWTFLTPSFAPYGANHWVGSNGLLPYFEICEGSCGRDESPAISLVGGATTTVEYGSVFVDPGATAHDAADGDITSSIRVLGSVNTGVMGTTTLVYSVTNSHGLSATATRTVVVACTHDCVSNVMFLPGIEGSRLYEGTGCGKSAEEKLWEPYDGFLNAVSGAGDKKMGELSLNSSGASQCSDIYTKEGDIIDSAGGNIYKSFTDEMNSLKNTEKVINDWRPVAYDWRLSLPDLLAKGAERDGKIFYEEATSTPYIEQTLRALAASSKTGKVTIVAHSNGGLIAKALMKKLGDTEAAKLIDRMVMVAVPQGGAPTDVGALLVGNNAGIYSRGVTIVSNKAARVFAQNSPMAYHLLPSQAYFDNVMYDPTHPVASFSGGAYPKEEAVYGNAIGTEKELTDFLLAKDGGRTQAADRDLYSAKILNPTLIGYATTTHDILDYTTPPAGIKVDQIAGWGVDTVSGIHFYSEGARAPFTRLYRPVQVEDGDGTVPVPSALMMSTSTNPDVKDYWVDLYSYFKETKDKRQHADLFEIPQLRDLVTNIIKSNNDTLPSYIQTTRPLPNDTTKKLTYFLHSPLTLQITDVFGSVTGLSTDGSVTEGIPGSNYGEFGEVKYVTVPEGNVYQLSMRGLASGTFSLDMLERSGGTVTASSTIAGVPTTASTTVTMAIPADVSAPSPMMIDENGDGKIDATITPKLGDTVVFDAVPPEFKVTFATSTNSIALIATDNMGSTTMTTTTEYPPLKKKQKEPHGIATTTVLATDAAGNTTALVYTEKFPSPDKRDTIALNSIAYNCATTTLKSTSLSYEWKETKRDTYELFASYLHVASSTLESYYRPKKNQTILMTRPQDIDDSDDDDDTDIRPTRQILPGMVVPYITTEKGSVIIDY